MIGKYATMYQIIKNEASVCLNPGKDGMLHSGSKPAKRVELVSKAGTSNRTMTLKGLVTNLTHEAQLPFVEV